MQKDQIYFIIIFLFLLVSFLIYYYIFNIYEVTYSVEPPELYADNISTAVIRSVPLNAIGMRAPFRHSFTVFDINDGKDLVEIIGKNNNKGEIILRAKDRIGKVVVLIKAEHAILPSSVEINIYPNLASIRDKGVKNL